MAPAAIQAQATSPPVQKSSGYVPRGDVTATLNFFTLPEDGSAPYNYVEQQTDGRPQRNFGDAFEDVTIHDIRNSESDFNLDKDAFQTVSGVSSAMTEDDWLDDETIKRVYYPEVEKLILETVPGSYKVTFFDHTLRRTEKNAKREPGPREPVQREPVQRVHVDQTNEAASWRVTLHDPENSEELLQGRYRIINVWRSIDGPVESFPLAFASAATIGGNDLHPVEHRYPHRTGQTAGVLYNPAQKFYYWSGMDNEDRVFLKCSDNREGVGKSAPHTAFVHQKSSKNARGRASIEVRTIVYG